MKNTKHIKIVALFLILTLLLSIVNTGTNESSDTGEKVYSDWIRIETPLDSEEDPDALGSRDLRPLLRDAVLLDAEGIPLAKGDEVWPVEPEGPYRVRLSFRDLQPATEGEPLVFPLPKGLSVGDENLSLPVRLELETGETLETVCAYDAGSGTLSLDWDSGAASLEVEFPAVFGDVDALAFADQLTVSLLPAAMKSRSTQDPGSDLRNFLTDFSVSGVNQEDGTYTIQAGAPYTIKLHFEEAPGGLQFNEHQLIYHFPQGFTPSPSSLEGTINLTGEGGVVACNYVIDEDTITITIDETSPAYQSFIQSETAEFDFWVSGIISQDKIEFSDQVTGDFNIDTSCDVTVKKVGSYDAGRNQVKYTIEATSKGNNDDVHIGDIIRGDALTYDPASLTVSSSVSGPVDPVSSGIMDTREGETFGLTIPSMVHGETVTVEYYANVNLDLLAEVEDGHYGTFELTGNKANVYIGNNPPGHEVKITGDNFENKISLSTNSKTALSQTVHGDKTYVTWQIILNENANISIAGKTITDTIEASSQAFMRYSGAGIHVEKYEKDGTRAGSSDIRWGTSGLSDGSGGSTWTYTIPQSDENHNYRYVITYETEVDSNAFLTQTTVRNTVENKYDKDEGAVDVDTTGEGVEAEKTAVTSRVNTVANSAETDWEITFTVPTAGLSSATIIDTLPSRRNINNNLFFYDSYIPNSFSVEPPLLTGENASIREENHQLIIKFTKSNGDPGLTGTGQTRRIHVRLTTKADPDWLTYANSNYPADPMARKHTNTAVVIVNDQEINLDSTVIYNTSPYKMEKVLVETYKTNNTNPPLPIYLYRIYLTNVTDEAFDSEGYITIHDTYDSDYLVYKTEYDSDNSRNINPYNGHVYGSTQYYREGYSYEGPYVVDASSTEGHLVFKIPKDQLPKLDGAYHYYYSVVYALQVKDVETLNRMQQEALQNNGLKVGLSNTAWSDKYGSETIVTEYTVKALEKKRVLKPDGTYDEGFNSDTGTYDLKFSIIVNPDGLRIGNEDTITVKDTLTNLSFDYTSIQIDPSYPDDTLNRVGNSIIFTLHNEQPYTITYTSRLIGMQNVHWNNKAELYGYISSVNDTSQYTSGGSGTFSNYHMYVKKYAEGNMNKGLSASFDLYEARVKGDQGQDIAYEWYKVGSFTTNANTGLYYIDNVLHQGETEMKSLRPYSYHDSQGNEQFGASYGWRYKIVETVAPDGYQKTTVEYLFGISDIPNYSDYIYLNNDTVTIVNQPVPAQVETAVSGVKTLIGKQLENEEFTFSLRPEDHIKEAWGEGYPGGFDGSLTAFNDADGHFRFGLSFTYADYLRAEEKGYVGADHLAYFYYVVKENLPEGAEDNFWNGVVYDQSEFLVVVKLFVDGEHMRTEVSARPYDSEAGAPTDHQTRRTPKPLQVMGKTP